MNEIRSNDKRLENNDLIIASLRTSLQQVKENPIHPISELWDGIDV